MKTSLISYPVGSMGSKKARDSFDSYKADYAALYTLLDAFVITDGRITRDFTPTEHHRWCSTCGMDMTGNTVARWFRDLMAHITHHVRFQLGRMQKAKGSVITSLESLNTFMDEVDGLTIPNFVAPGLNAMALFDSVSGFGNDDHKKFMLTGDRKAANMCFSFSNNNIYMRNLISTIVLMELHRNSGSPVTKNRGETNLSWFTRIEEHMGIRTAKTRKDKPSKLPRKAHKSW